MLESGNILFTVIKDHNDFFFYTNGPPLPLLIWQIKQIIASEFPLFWRGFTSSTILSVNKRIFIFVFSVLVHMHNYHRISRTIEAKKKKKNAGFIRIVQTHIKCLCIMIRYV